MQGTFRLFRVVGITVYLHFSWFIVGVIEVQSLSRRYTSPVWAVYEYLALFAIVLMHEFGHALACRQTGGLANRIVLWPLGGIAFVTPPPRPGAILWSIAAGPLVNVALLPILYVASQIARHSALAYDAPDVVTLIDAVQWINACLLIFNILPVYPLDGGQILRALLWFPLGPIVSLKIASAVGIVGAIGFGLLALWMRSIWLGVIAFFLISRAIQGWQNAKELAPETGTNQPPPETERTL